MMEEGPFRPNLGRLVSEGSPPNPAHEVPETP